MIARELVEDESGSIEVIRLDRPDKRNAMLPEMLESLAKAVERILDPLDIAEVGTEADDHFLSSLQQSCGEVAPKATEGCPSTTLRAVPLPVFDREERLADILTALRPSGRASV